jgi:plastocyanin
MMSWRPVAALVVGALLALAACGSGGGRASPLPVTAGPSGTAAATASPAPSALRGATSSPAASASLGGSASPAASASAGQPSSPAASLSPGAAVCRRSGDPGAVAVSITDFEFKPASIAAEVGQVVAFSNTGFEPHNATVGAGCATRTLQTGESDGLVFSVPGSYRFACTVHAWMTGTFTIAP